LHSPRIQTHRTDGELSPDDFSETLEDAKSYPAEKHQFRLDLMERFELSFPLQGIADTCLVPGLLGENQPRELKKFQAIESG